MVVVTESMWALLPRHGGGRHELSSGHSICTHQQRENI